MKTNKLIAEFPNQEKGKSNNYQSYHPEVFCKKSGLRNSQYSHENLKKKKKKNFMAPFYGWGSTASRLQPL